MQINQRDIIELNFQLPNGSSKVHPAFVISNRNVLDAENIFYALMISSKDYHDDFSFKLTNNMLGKPLSRVSFVKCQLIQAYTLEEVISKISSIKLAYFEEVKQLLFSAVF